MVAVVASTILWLFLSVGGAAVVREKRRNCETSDFLHSSTFVSVIMVSCEKQHVSKSKSNDAGETGGDKVNESALGFVAVEGGLERVEGGANVDVGWAEDVLFT